MNYKRIKRNNSPVLFLFMSYSRKTVVEKEPQNSAIRNLFLAEALSLAFVYISWFLESEDPEDLSLNH